MVKYTENKKRQLQELTEQQKLFVEYLSDPDNSETPEEFAKRIGVSCETLVQWKTNPVLVQSAFQLCVTRLGAEIPKVLKMLLEKTLGDKDISACKLFLKHIDKITEIPETGLSVDEALQLINSALERQDNKNDITE